MAFGGWPSLAVPDKKVIHATAKFVWAIVPETRPWYHDSAMADVIGVSKSMTAFLRQFPGIEMAFFFGSRVKKTSTEESDIDVAVYFTPIERPFDFEITASFPDEHLVWEGLERIAGVTTDFVVLNRAPATLAHAILHDGIPLLVRDSRLYWDYYLTVSREAEDFRAWTEDYWMIKRRSRSLSDIDKARLIRMVDFLESEMRDYDSFNGLTRGTYETQGIVRRNAERFVENIVNAGIDIAKIVLASSGMPIPQTYGETLANLSMLEDFDSNVAERLSQFAKLRNIIAHEYLDIRFDRINRFIFDSQPAYRYLVEYVKSQFLKASG